MQDETRDPGPENAKPQIRRSHQFVFILIALLALATFAFGILALIGLR